MNIGSYNFGMTQSSMLRYGTSSPTEPDGKDLTETDVIRLENLKMVQDTTDFLTNPENTHERSREVMREIQERANKRLGKIQSEES